MTPAYEAADYAVFADPEIRFRIGEANEGLDDLLEGAAAQCAAFLTAVNPRSERKPPDENVAAMRSLESEVSAAGFPWLPGEGRDPHGQWPPEPSLFVLGISVEEAAALGRRYGQNAIVFVEKGLPPELVVLR